MVLEEKYNLGGFCGGRLIQTAGRHTREWLESGLYQLIDPDIGFYSGPQYPTDKENFGIFLDSIPDTWGKTLMKRREAQNERE
ncbi:hypothetical protein [Marixanthomonas ophiurae]|uniref:hypothetical protein n=1 Tax=Marixanthomonas ophiurae TaxID=387659 RepID=UPI00131430C0|nr:hypothetical protein [Marixanthomonas ophiurae]